MNCIIYRSRFILNVLIVLILVVISGCKHTPLKPIKLVAVDGMANDFFGYGVAQSGNTVVIGAPKVDHEIKGEDVGAAYVFTRHGNDWKQEAKLFANDGMSKDEFGGQVAILDDTIIVGVIRDDTLNGVDSGSAYVFTRVDKNWVQQAKLTANDATQGDSFGWSIGFSGDTAIIGAPHDDDKGNKSGSAYVFTRTGNTWIQQAKLTATDGSEGDVFGISASLSGDTVVIGADLNEEKGFNAGAAYVFTRTDNIWTQQAKLMANDGAKGDIFGVRVALDGDTALISARRDDDDIMGVDSGSAYVFTRTRNTWSQQAKLTAPDGAADDRFARSVALDGDTAVIGAMFQDEKGENSGSAYVFKRTGNTWHFNTQLTADDGAAGDVFGWHTSLIDNRAIISANRDNDKGENSGSVYLFDIKQ